MNCTNGEIVTDSKNSIKNERNHSSMFSTALRKLHQIHLYLTILGQFPKGGGGGEGGSATIIEGPGDNWLFGLLSVRFLAWT